MSKTALLEAIHALDLPRVQGILGDTPTLKTFRSEKGFNLLQLCCSRSTVGNTRAADRQLALARWLVSQGFDPRAMHTTAPGEDGEEQPATLSLVWFAVAKAQNTGLARFFLEQGAAANAMFAAAWWGNAEILEDLVTHGDDINRFVGATPLHMAIDVLYRGVEGKPDRAKRRLACVVEMLRLGADPNVAAHDGTTPLHTVLKKDYGVAVFTLLLKHGANPDVPGKDGRSVREIAARKKDQRYFRALS
jgi:hypothetical protein